MIRIEIWNDHLVVKGHANADEKGKDIYCAGVSAIVMGAINWFNPNEINYKIDDGYLELQLINKSKECLDKMLLMFIQLSALDTKENQKYIRIIDHSKGE